MTKVTPLPTYNSRLKLSSFFLSFFFVLLPHFYFSAATQILAETKGYEEEAALRDLLLLLITLCYGYVFFFIYFYIDLLLFLAMRERN
jgi:hypothetical protein